MSPEETVNATAHQLHACANRIRQIAAQVGSAPLAQQLAAVADALLDHEARLRRAETIQPAAPLPVRSRRRPRR